MIHYTNTIDSVSLVRVDFLSWKDMAKVGTTIVATDFIVIADSYVLLVATEETF